MAGERVRLVLACQVMVLLIVPTLLLAADPAPQVPPDPDGEEETGPGINLEDLEKIPPPSGPPSIHAPVVPSHPDPGKGRIHMVLAGNRKWCTSPDDRVVKPPEKLTQVEGRPLTRNPVFTYGYQFTIAAVARANPGETLLLFESPVIRTALLRLAGKMGRGGNKPPGPPVPSPDPQPKAVTLTREEPGSLVPDWQELNRCVSMPETFDFDLAPGAYDIYMAFDIMTRSGGWAHRSIGFQTDVVLEEQRTTRLDGTVNFQAGGLREVDFVGSVLQPQPVPGTGAP